MASHYPCTIPDYLEATFIAPDMSKIGVFRTGDMIPTDWKYAGLRMRRNYSFTTLRIPWGPMVVMIAGCAIVYKHFGYSGLLAAGIVVWMTQAVATNVSREIEDRRQAAARMSDSSPSAGRSSRDGRAPRAGDSTDS
jgi:hypothetical protein